MSKAPINLSDFQDMHVIGLSGHNKRVWKPKRVELTVSNSVEIDTDLNVATVTVELELFGFETAESLGDEEPQKESTYTGSVVVRLVPKKEFTFSEDDSQALDTLESVWPTARTLLYSHANQLGCRILSMPLTLKPNQFHKDES